MAEQRNAYAAAGVNVDIEAEASRILYEASKMTFDNRKGSVGEIVFPFDDFAGLKAVSIENLPPGSFLSLGFDTAGTKVEIAQRVGKHDTIAYDLFAMVCDDAIVRGGEPALVGSNLDIRSLGSDERFLPTMRELAAGYVAAAREANVAVINGEIAQMGGLVSGWGDFPYHWGAACIWFGRKEKLFTGSEIKTGDAVVVFREPGFRTNGLSLVRSVFQKRYGEQWHKEMLGASPLGEQVLTPSVIYSRCMVRIHGGFGSDGSCVVHGAAHITGGGIPEKLGRVLRRSGLGARLTDLYDMPAIVRHCQEMGDISDEDAYGTWNMGQGMAVITPEPERVIEEAARFGIEGKWAGEITSAAGIRLISKGVERAGEELVF